MIQVNTDLDIVCEHTNTDPADTGEHTTTHHDDIFSSLLHFYHVIQDSIFIIYSPKYM